MQQFILIVAGGKGSRMGSDLPKQFLPLGGVPLLMHTFDAFSFLYGSAEIILVLPSDIIDLWKKICGQYEFAIPHKIVEGGPKRFHSVKSGLRVVPGDSVVAIHDAARPLVSKKTITTCFEIAERKGNAVPSIAINESVREVDGSLNHSIDRNKLRIIQTPQVFKSSLIRRAYNQAYDEKFSDDASVLESMGEPIYLVPGNPENIKITRSMDLILAERLISRNSD